MSSLLQNVLASRLAQATLGEQRTASYDNETTTQRGSSAMGPPVSGARGSSSIARDGGTDDDWEKVDSGDVASDEEFVGVVSLPGTVPGTPHISRPPSPGGTRPPLSSKRSALAKSQTLGVAGAPTKKSKTDPLRSLPKEISQRIFLSLPLQSLIALSLVNRRYRRSATLNYCWYRQCNRDNMHDDYDDVKAATDGGIRWTRRASKMDWKTQYAKQRRIEAREQQRLESLPGSGAATPSRTQRLRDEGVKTASEMRQEEWQEQEQTGYSKEEMREWYKAQGGTKGGKLKGKRGKGGAKTGADAGSLWE